MADPLILSQPRVKASEIESHIESLSDRLANAKQAYAACATRARSESLTIATLAPQLVCDKLRDVA